MSSEPVAPSTFSALPAPPLGYVRSTPAVDASETLHFAVPKSNAAGHPLTEARHTNLPYFQAAVPAPKAKAEPRRQRQHAPEGALASVRPFQFMYYHQAPRDDSDGPPLAWSTREVHIEDPPLPRQRSAQACQKCRKRKTKCCGGQPCMRCKARGLECVYNEKVGARKNEGTTFEEAVNVANVKDEQRKAPSPFRSPRVDRRHHPYLPRTPVRVALPAAEEQANSSGPQYSIAQSLGLQHVREPMGTITNLDHRHTQNDGAALPFPPFVGAAYLQPVHPGLEMSSMVEGFPVWDPSQAAGSLWDFIQRMESQEQPASDNAAAPASESPKRFTNVSSSKVETCTKTEQTVLPSVAVGEDNHQPGMAESKSTEILRAALLKALAPQALPIEAIALQYPPTPDICTEGAIEHTIIRPSASFRAQTIDPTLLLAANARTQPVRSLPVALEDVFSAGYVSSQPTELYCGTGPSPSVSLQFEDFFNFSPNDRLSPGYHEEGHWESDDLLRFGY